jgi:hypothetical protein
MYEKPQLNRVGDAQDVILGAYALGNDLDGSYMTDQDEFASDAGQPE